MDFIDTLTENQRKIYEIAKNYLSRNPHFTINELYLACKKYSDMSDDEIFNVLESFIRKKFFIKGSRITKVNVLKNEKRQAIYEFIIKNPGSALTSIMNHFNLGPHAGRWHLEMLKRFSFIRERKYMFYKLFFHQDFPEDKELLVFLLRNPKVLNIYLCLQYNSFKVSSISKILNLHPSTIHYHLKKLQKNNMIFANYDNTYSINHGNVSFLKQYFDLNIPTELKKKLNDFLKKDELNTSKSNVSDGQII